MWTIEELLGLDELGAVIFPKINKKSGYHQVSMHADGVLKNKFLKSPRKLRGLGDTVWVVVDKLGKYSHFIPQKILI